jgi:hypothetical protein
MPEAISKDGGGKGKVVVLLEHLNQRNHYLEGE